MKDCEDRPVAKPPEKQLCMFQHGLLKVGLERYGFNESQAATFIGVSPETFSGWLNENKVPQDEDLTYGMRANLRVFAGVKHLDSIWPNRRHGDQKKFIHNVDVPAPGPSQEDIVFQGERRELINKVLASWFTEQDAEIAKLLLEGNFDAAEIAAARGKTQRQVHGCAQRIRKQLRHPLHATKLQKILAGRGIPVS